MCKQIITLLFISIIGGFFWGLNAQNTANTNAPLSDVLDVLEKRYEITFSYVDLTIANKTMSFPDENLSLAEVISLLSTSTNLDFIVVDNTNIVISKRRNPLSDFITQKLEEVVITNYLTQGISKKSDGKIVINTEDSKLLPGLIEPDILQTIQALPGILSVDERISNINVRGGTHDQNLILWEGIKMYQSGHFFGLVSAFNPYLTKDINVSKNGTSVKYGDGVSSVIDIRQSNTLDQDFKAGAGFNLIHADGFAKLPLNKESELQVSARRSITDLVLTPTYDQYLQRVFQDSDFSNTQNNAVVSNNERFYFYDIALKFLYDISDKDQLRINFSTINNSLDYDQKLNSDAAMPLKNTLNQNNLATGITYLKYWNNKLTTTAQLYLSNYDLKASNFNLINEQQLQQDNAVNDVGIKINATNHIDNNLKLHGGYQFSEISIENAEIVDQLNFTSFTKEINRSHAFYGEAEFTSLNRDTYARIGLRTNYIEKFSEIFTEPRISVSHKLSNDFRLEFLAEFKSQTTSQVIDFQNDFLGIEKRRWMLSNDEDIPIIKSKQGAVGIHYNKNKLLISLEAFVKSVENITAQSQGFQNQFQFENAIGAYETKGIDFLINKQFQQLSTWLSYSFSNNDYRFADLNEGQTFPNNLDIRHALTFATTYSMEAIDFAFGLNWRSGKPATNPTTNQNTTNNTIEYEAPNSSRLNDYIRADLSVSYQLKVSTKTKASVAASIWNVFDRRNVINRYFVEDENNLLIAIENLSLGITPNVSFRLSF
ncbi:FecR domain-containing protein [Sediminibacter sp. Hel_I_10]|uniref:FecR domain-containing protein n=1 Tax=Sediminibacter sp. Hel_I_10 TaxID=1392490 RepID=UPI00047BA2A9|nr:FecR domain-containing protein [Sediminibacter sp. Hel_I_10]